MLSVVWRAKCFKFFGAIGICKLHADGTVAKMDSNEVVFLYGYCQCRSSEIRLLDIQIDGLFCKLLANRSADFSAGVISF